MVTAEHSPEEVLRKAQELLVSLPLGDSSIRTRGKPQRPLPVNHPEGGVYSWLVPIALRRKRVGYVQLSAELEFMRYVTVEPESKADEAPGPHGDWLDPRRARKKAAALVRPNETLSKPMLTYDQYPDRLVWQLDARSKRGGTRKILVAGDTAFEQVNLEDTLGGLESQDID